MKDSNFRISEKQERDLIDYLMDRLDQLKTDNEERISADKLSWNTYNNDRSDRVQHDTIYAQSNVPIPMTSLVVDHFLARAEDEITGTSPYFKFVPQGPSDLGSAESFDKYFNWKLETRGRIRERLEESYLHVFIQRAAILKSVYEEKFSQWLDFERNALFNRETGQFEEILDYGPILEGEASFTPSIDPASGMAEMRLDQDPSFVMRPEIHEFSPFPEGIPTQQIKYQGPRTVVVDSDRFLCPSTVENVEDADVIMELYDKSIRWVNDLFYESEWFKYGDFANMIKKDANPQTDSVKNDDYKENLSFDNDKFPMVQVVECWVRRDIMGTGIPQEFVVFMEPQCRKIIYYEYIAKVTPDNKIPYNTISIGKYQNRWWGQSLPERLRV